MNDNQPRIYRLKQSLRRSAEKGHEIPDKTRVLYEIGRHAAAREYNLPTPPEDFFKQYGLPVLPLTLKDLENVCHVLDNFAWTNNSHVLGCTTGDVFKSYNVSTKANGLPTATQLPKYFERAYKGLLRDCLEEAREDDSQNNTTMAMTGLHLPLSQISLL
ncbi:hypothetical protein ACHAP8_010496 [Fusarium lateritium]